MRLSEKEFRVEVMILRMAYLIHLCLNFLFILIATPPIPQGAPSAQSSFHSTHGLSLWRPISRAYPNTVEGSPALCPAEQNAEAPSRALAKFLPQVGDSSPESIPMLLCRIICFINCLAGPCIPCANECTCSSTPLSSYNSFCLHSLSNRAQK